MYIVNTDCNLSSYMEKIKIFPILSEEEERSLVEKFSIDGDIKAAHKLVTSHLRLVVNIAIKFRSYGLPLMDLISEGNIGLMKAVRKFSLSKGTRLSTYAMWWIKAFIQDYIIKSWSMLKVSSNVLQKKLFSKNEKIKEKIAAADDNRYITSSLNEYVNGDESSVEVMDLISDSSVSHEQKFMEKEDKESKISALKKSINLLNDREKDVIMQRRLKDKPLTLDELSKKYSVSGERIRQIENAALKKIKTHMLS